MRCLRSIVLFLVIIIGNTWILNAQPGPEEYLRIRIPVPDKKQLSEAKFEFFREDYKNDSLDLTVSSHELAQFNALYPGMKLLPLALLVDESDMALTFEEALTFTKYPTYPQYDSMMHYFADNFPEICLIDTFGTTAQGRLLLALKISDNVEDNEDEPAFLYTSTMHGDELIGFILLLRLADFMLNNYQTDVEVTRLINELEIWINPNSNPDATYYNDNDNSLIYSQRSYIGGKDLNRNFPDPSAGQADDTTGRERETRIMMEFLRMHEFNLSANLHSGAEVVNYPWDHKYARHPDNEWFILISQEYVDEAHAVNPSYMSLIVDDSTGISGISNGADWYVIKGGRQDYVNYYLHGREVTLELSNIKKLESEQLDNHWNYNQWSLINYMSQARYGIHGNISSKYSAIPLKAKIWILDHDNDSSWIESDSISGNFYRYLKEGIYDIVVSSEGYITDTITEVTVYDYEKTELAVKLDSTIVQKANLSQSEKLVIYPNPSRETIHLHLGESPKEKGEIYLYTVQGTLAEKFRLLPGIQEYHFDISGLQGGYYLVRVILDHGVVQRKILVQ